MGSGFGGTVWNGHFQYDIIRFEMSSEKTGTGIPWDTPKSKCSCYMGKVMIQLWLLGTVALIFAQT